MVKAPGNKISRGLFTVNDFESDTITTGKYHKQHTLTLTDGQSPRFSLLMNRVTNLHLSCTTISSKTSSSIVHRLARSIDDQISCGIYLIGRLKEVQINLVHVSGRRLDAQLLSPAGLDLLIGNGPSHAGIGCETGNPTAD